MGIRTCFTSSLPLLMVILMTTACKTTSAPANPSDSSSLRPPIGVHTLDNGLTVYTLEDHNAPLVTYEVWFRVGSGEEQERRENASHGITGLSHFFEHMMFRGTPKHPKFFDEVYALGGKLNAWTWLDSTVYWEKVPSRHLSKIIEYEADRLENMAMDFLNLEPEREVVKSERLLRTENSASGAMSELMDATAFRTHSYHWPTVGWMRDLNAITLDEARAHHSAFYAPNNAMVVVVGDFNTAEVMKTIQKEYGHLPSRELPKSERQAEPEQTQERRDYLLKEVEADQFKIGYRVPSMNNPDSAVIEIIDQILNGGKSSRLKQELIFGAAPVVSELGSYTLPIRDPYLYLWSIKMLPGQSNAKADAAITSAMEKLAQEPVSERELTTAINRLQASVIREMLTNQQRADLIGFGVLITGNPSCYFDRLANYEAVKVEDVQRVAAKYLVKSNRTTITAVSPSRAEELGKAWAQSDPSPSLDALLVEALKLDQDLRDLEAKEGELDLEETAIKLLEERAQTALEEAASSSETQEKIKSYMAENEKGNVVRTKLLTAERERLAEVRKGLSERHETLKSRVTQLPDAAKEENPNRVAIATLFALNTKPQQGVQLDTSKDGAAPAHALLGLWLDAHQETTAANAAKRQVLAMPGDTPADVMARNLAHDSLRLDALPRAQTIGGR